MAAAEESIKFRECTARQERCQRRFTWLIGILIAVALACGGWLGTEVSKLTDMALMRDRNLGRLEALVESNAKQLERLENKMDALLKLNR